MTRVGAQTAFVGVVCRRRRCATGGSFRRRLWHVIFLPALLLDADLLDSVTSVAQRYLLAHEVCHPLHVLPQL